jgi:hypothetical protein
MKPTCEFHMQLRSATAREARMVVRRREYMTVRGRFAVRLYIQPRPASELESITFFLGQRPSTVKSEQGETNPQTTEAAVTDQVHHDQPIPQTTDVAVTNQPHHRHHERTSHRSRRAPRAHTISGIRRIVIPVNLMIARLQNEAKVLERTLDQTSIRKLNKARRSRIPLKARSANDIVDRLREQANPLERTLAHRSVGPQIKIEQV